MSNLLEKASIITTPTAYNDGKLLSVKPSVPFGSELVNETTDNISGWVDARSNATLSIVDNNIRATYNTGSTMGVSSTGFTCVVGKKYRVQINATRNNTDGNLFARVSEIQDLGTTVVNESTTSDSLSIDVVFVATATTHYVGILATSQGSGDFIQASLITVKEKTDADFDFSRGSSATRVNSQGLIEDVQIIGGDLVQNGDFSQEGSELITNGDFSTDSNWFKGGSATISGGYLNLTASGDFAQQSITNPSHYVVRINVSSVTTSGDLRIRSSNFAETFTFSVTSAQVYTFYSPISADGFVLQSNGFIGLIDNVSVVEVGQSWDITQGAVGDNRASFSTTNGSFAAIQQNNILTVGKRYKYSFEILSITGSVYFLNNNINYTTTGVKYGEFTSSYNFLQIKATVGINNTSAEITNISVKEITDDTDLPRIDYTDGVGSILLENSSTNLITYSEDFSQWTLGSNATLALDNSVTAPDGSTGVYRLTLPATGSTFIQSNTFSTITGTLSIYVKSAGTVNNDFNLYGGFGAASSLKTATSEWQRFTFEDIQCSGFLIVNSGDTFISDIYIWGAQVEQKSFPTSYIPTVGSSVTRLGETLTNSGNADLFNSEEGVLYAEISALTNISTATKRVITLKNTDSSKRASIIYNTDSTLAFFFSESPTVFYQTSAYDITQNLKIAFKYKENDFAVWVNGVEIFTDTSNNTFTADTLNGLHFNEFGTNSPFYGKTKCVAVFKEALTDAELQCLTT